METLSGSIERITYQNTENGFTIAHLQTSDQKDPVRISGMLPGLTPGECIRCWGQWKKHLVYGWQFEVTSFRSELPADVNGIKKYLGSGLIKGIGKKYAERIVDVFGAATLDILDTHPERLNEVKGLGEKRQQMIIKCWGEQRCIRDVMIFLQGHGVSSGHAQKIFKTYGENSLKRLQENPYCMAKDIHGIGFKTADQIAEKLGMPHDAPQRVDAGVEFALFELSSEGHVCYPLAEFLPIASELLSVEPGMIEERIRVLEREERIALFPLTFAQGQMPYVWLKGLFLSECGIARELLRLLCEPCPLRSIDTAKAIAWAQEQLGLTLAVNQAAAVEKAVSEKIHIITGGPGTGKSTITRAILVITQQLTKRIVLAAPTGRAAKRMSEITGFHAKTIHSLLEWDFNAGNFKRNKQNPIEADLVVIDEASMIDTSLMYSLLKAIPSGARVIWVGDVNQLPSVGPGNVLKDLIASKAFSTTVLNEIFRQAAHSRIITNAHRINSGRMPDLTLASDSDFFFVEANEPEEVLHNVVTLASERLPRKYGYHPLQDIQILAPMRKGVFGIDNLNLELQKVLNPHGTPLVRMGRSFKKGDKIMQTRNNYKKEVYNGDVGIIDSIDMTSQELVAVFDNKEVIYDFTEIDELVLAYAVSIHKYQGSECRCIIIPFHTSHYKMLGRNLLYTGVTRGKNLVLLVGNKKAVYLAVTKDDVLKRHTGLRQALEGTCIRLPV